MFDSRVVFSLTMLLNIKEGAILESLLKMRQIKFRSKYSYPLYCIYYLNYVLLVLLIKVFIIKSEPFFSCCFSLRTRKSVLNSVWTKNQLSAVWKKFRLKCTITMIPVRRIFMFYMFCRLLKITCCLKRGSHQCNMCYFTHNVLWGKLSLVLFEFCCNCFLILAGYCLILTNNVSEI